MAADSGRNRPNIWCVRVILPVFSSCYIHIRHHGSSISAYGQTACCQGMRLPPQLMGSITMTNSSAVACLFCWASLNTAPSSRDPSRCLYHHSFGRRSGQSHPAIPQAAATTTPSPPYPAQPSAHSRRKDPLFTSRVARRISSHKHKQWQRHSWKCQPQAQARQSRHARCLCPNGSAAVHVVRSAHHRRPRQHPLRPHDCWRKRCRCRLASVNQG